MGWIKTKTISRYCPLKQPWTNRRSSRMHRSLPRLHHSSLGSTSRRLIWRFHRFVHLTRRPGLAQFFLRNINQDNLLFYHVLGALPELEVQRMDKLQSAQHFDGQKPQPTFSKSWSSKLSRGRVSDKCLSLPTRCRWSAARRTFGAYSWCKSIVLYSISHLR